MMLKHKAPVRLLCVGYFLRERGGGRKCVAEHKSIVHATINQILHISSFSISLNNRRFPPDQPRCIAEGCVRPIRAPHPTRAGVNNPDFPSCQKPVSREIIAKQQFWFWFFGLCPERAGALTVRVRLQRPSSVSFTMRAPAQLRIAGELKSGQRH